MSNYTTYPRQDAFESSLLSDIDSSTLSVVLNDSPSFTLSGANRCYGVIDYDNNLLEIVKIQSISGATLTLESRGIAKYEGGSSTAVAHSAGAKFAISHDWINFSDIATAIATKADIAGQVFTGQVSFSGTANNGLVVNSLTTVQRDALATPVNGQIIYNTTDGEFQIYQGGAWSTMASGSTQPDASTTVAGKVEQAVASEIGASTEFGATGAPLFINPTSVVKTSSGAGDENKLPVLNASGQLAAGFLDLTGKTDKSTLTTKGDIYAASAASTPVRVGVGADGTTLVADSAQSSGVKYITRTYLLDVDTTPVSFTNTTTETTILSLSVPAGHLGTNGGLIGRVNLSALDIATGDSITFRLKLGATTIGTITIGNPSGARTDLGYLEFEIFNLNSASSQYGLIRVFASSASTADQAPDLWWNQDGGTSAINTASAATLAVTGQFNDTSLNNVCTSESYHVRILGEA